MTDYIKDGVQTGHVSEKIVNLSNYPQNVEEHFKFISHPTLKDLEDAEKDSVIVISLIPLTDMNGIPYEDYDTWLRGFFHGLYLYRSNRHAVFFYEGAMDLAKKQIFDYYGTSRTPPGFIRAGNCNIIRQPTVVPNGE